MDNKIKILFYGDSPTCATGFGTLNRGILTNLYKTGKYDITIIGVNYFGDYDKLQSQFKIYPAVGGPNNDPYGRQKFANIVLGEDTQFDVLFMVQDSFTLEFMAQVFPKLRQVKKFTSICYYPVDGVPKQSWIQAMSMFDFPITYTEFARQESVLACPQIADRLNVIYHGVNVENFHPLPKKEVDDFRQQYFGHHASKFLVANVGRNQQRKDMPRTMMAFKEFKKRRPNSVLYIHAAVSDQGGNLYEAAKAIGLKPGEDVLFPGNNFTPQNGYPVEVLNLVYNSADVVVSNTLGEGWGLTSIEAMACRKPILFPNNTSLKEIIGAQEERGYFIKSGDTPNDFIMIPNDLEVLRPITNIIDMAEKLVHIYDNREEAAKKAEAGYQWVVNNLRWDKHIAPKWDKVISDAVVSMVKKSTGPQIVSAEDL